MGYWQDWVAGWYWQTDEHHRLVTLKPDHEAAASWLEAKRLTGAGLPLWECMALKAGAADEASRVALSRLEMRVKSGLPLDVDGLPWAIAPGGAVTCSPSRLIGMPRTDAQGRFAGYHGVWRHTGAAVGAPVDISHAAHGAVSLPPEDDGLASPPAPMSEAEQEVLRYALSHDLRAPLRVVDGFTRIVKEDYGRVMDRIGNDHLERILAATTRMNGMIDAILEQAQLAQAPVARTPVDVSELAQDVVAEQRAAQRSGLSGEAHAAPVEIVVEPGMQAPADPLLVRRVLDNLIGNALKYSGKVAHPRVEVGRVAATDPCVFYVRDNGAGFDMQHADKLFGLFQRFHSNKDFPGTGVGLAGVQNIVRRHGGRVWAEAAPGQGACFYFTLMASASATSLRAPINGPSEAPGPLTDLAGTPLPPVAPTASSVQRSQA
ncbi:MAG TPA: hypothetical protein H9903_04490 [Candidatus Aquabacterium excrementipullorum]|nr:hypothetical protein [Candidatus Aquabacterium excrementipullorum]